MRPVDFHIVTELSVDQEFMVVFWTRLGAIERF